MEQNQYCRGSWIRDPVIRPRNNWNKVESTEKNWQVGVTDNPSLCIHNINQFTHVKHIIISLITDYIVVSLLTEQNIINIQTTFVLATLFLNNNIKIYLALNCLISSIFHKLIIWKEAAVTPGHP